MEQNTKEMLEQRIQELLEELDSIPAGSDEHVKVCEAIDKLSKVLLEQTRNEASFGEFESKEDLDIKRFRLEEEFKKREAEEQKKNQRIQYVISIAGIVIPVTASVVMDVLCLHFEEHGTLTSLISRTVFGQNKIRK